MCACSEARGLSQHLRLHPNASERPFNDPPGSPCPTTLQLTINLVALIVAFVAAITNGETPLNVLQLLWVNLIMDSLAALGELSLGRAA